LAPSLGAGGAFGLGQDDVGLGAAALTGGLSQGLAAAGQGSPRAVKPGGATMPGAA
jgi:hypothetical protein